MSISVSITYSCFEEEDDLFKASLKIFYFLSSSFQS